MVDRAEPQTSALAGLANVVTRSSDPVQLDSVDRALLQLLARDARTSQRQLAKAINMSAPAVGERIAKLERLGVISGYRVAVNWAAIGLPILVYIPMTITPGTELQSLTQALTAVPELEQLSVVTGGYDLIARFRVSDYNHLQEMLLDRLYPISGLQRFETFLSLGEVAVDDVLDRAFSEAMNPHDRGLDGHSQG